MAEPRQEGAQHRSAGIHRAAWLDRPGARGGHVRWWGAAGRLPRELDGRHTQHRSLVRPARLLHGWRRSGRRFSRLEGRSHRGAAGAPVPSWVAPRLGSGEPPEAATGETGMAGTMGAIPTMVLFKSFAPGERPAGPGPTSPVCGERDTPQTVQTAACGGTKDPQRGHGIMYRRVVLWCRKRHRRM